MDLNETKWKKKRIKKNDNNLAHDVSDNTLPNPPILEGMNSDIEMWNMKEKIKNTKKNRKSELLKSEPIQNIYDVVDNVYDDTEVIHEDPQIEGFKDVKGKIKIQIPKIIGPTPNPDNIPGKEKNISFIEIIVNAFSGKNNDFADAELQKELDQIFKNVKSANEAIKKDRFCKKNELAQNEISSVVRNAILKLKYPFIYSEFFIKKLGIIIGDIFSKCTATANEKKVIVRNINSLLCTFISFFIVYNWFFIWYYKDFNGNHIETTSISTDILKNVSSLLHYLFEFVLYPITLVYQALMNWIPSKLTNMIKSTNVAWVLLYIVFIRILYYFGSYFKNLFFESLTIFLNKQVKPSDYGKDSASYNTYPSLHLLIAFKYIGSFTNFLFTSPPFSMVSVFLNSMSGLFRMFVSHFFVTLTAMLIVLYIFVHSFFSMSIYSNASLSQTMKNIRKFIFETSMADEYTKCPIDYDCQKRTFFEQIFDFIKLIIDIIYVQILPIMLIATLVYSMFDYTLSIKNTNLKVYMIILTIFMMLFVGGSSIFSNWLAVKRTMDEQKETEIKETEIKETEIKEPEIKETEIKEPEIK